MFLVGVAALVMAAQELPSVQETGQQRRDRAAADVASGKLRYFPDKARSARINSGLAVLTCVVDADGWLMDCKLKSEEPPGFDFGATALRMAPMIKMKPRSGEAAPQTTEDRVDIPVRFKLPK